MEAVDLVCFRCKHYKFFEGKCDAFPNDIPDEIIAGLNEHSKPLPEQENEIVFEEGEPQDI